MRNYESPPADEKQSAEARDVILRWKKNLAKFENEQYKTGIASGEFLLVQGYRGDILQGLAEKVDIAFAMPREGGAISCDDLVIPKKTREVKPAHAFINFLHDPAVAAENTGFIKYHVFADLTQKMWRFDLRIIGIC